MTKVFKFDILYSIAFVKKGEVQMTIIRGATTIERDTKEEISLAVKTTLTDLQFTALKALMLKLMPKKRASSS